MNKLPKEIIDKSKKYKKDYKKIISLIKQYDRIAIFRHTTPDFDALGSQLAVKNWIKDNFPNKEVIALGDNHVSLTPKIYPEMDRVNEAWFRKPFLAILLDVANKKRIADPRYKNASYMIKIDHHPKVEDWGDLLLIDESFVACSEFIANFFIVNNKYKISKQVATYLYTGIVGDSGGFRYEATSTHTFLIASELVKKGVEITKTTQNMFQKPFNELELKKYVLNNFKLSPHGVAYYVLTDQTQKELKIETEQGKEVINLFQNIEGINAWVSVTEDVIDDCFRVSIRSLTTPINDVAAKYKGGGHPNASGARIKNISELPSLINDLDNLFVK